MIKENKNCFKCNKCGKEYSSMLGDNEIPKKCECENE